MLQLTYLDSNSWLIELAGKRILLDPWLVGSLMFANTSWLFKGDRPKDRMIPEQIDLILLSQGLEDHAHPPTLKQLDHTIPVVASPNAAKVVQGLAYQEIHTLEHGEVFQLDQLEIIAVPGSPVGPTTLENGYLLKDLKNNISLYYEPHGYHAEEIQKYAPVDIIITPLMNLTLPLLGPVIKGQASALKACQWLNPKLILPTAAGGDVQFEGLLLKFLKTEGSIVDFQNLLQQQGLSTQVIDPKPGQATPILLPV